MSYGYKEHFIHPILKVMCDGERALALPPVVEFIVLLEDRANSVSVKAEGRKQPGMGTM